MAPERLNGSNYSYGADIWYGRKAQSTAGPKYCWPNVCLVAPQPGRAAPSSDGPAARSWVAPRTQGLSPSRRPAPCEGGELIMRGGVLPLLSACQSLSSLAVPTRRSQPEP